MQIFQNVVVAFFLFIIASTSSSFSIFTQSKLFKISTHSFLFNHRFSIDTNNINSNSKDFKNEKNVIKILTALVSSFIIFSPNLVFAQDDKPNDPVAVDRFHAALSELQYLDKNWDSLVKGQGDNIRRKLGTVYSPPKCESPLCSFPIFVNKFVQAHQDDLDVPAFEEPITEVLEAINQVFSSPPCCFGRIHLYPSFCRQIS